MRYSLARYLLVIQLPVDFPTSFTQAFGQSLTIGGQGSMVGSISTKYNSDLWETDHDVTGGWTHNQNLDMSGTCTITIKQVAESVARFIRLCNCFYSSKLTFKEGLYIEVKDNEGNIVATCKDCYITQIPQQTLGVKAEDQDWVFTCGKITHHVPVF